MTDLKTFKDFFCANRQGYEGYQCPNCGMKHTATEEFLRAEAVKWVKQLRRGNVPEELKKLSRAPGGWQLNAVPWIIYFFNLSEDDLK